MFAVLIPRAVACLVLALAVISLSGCAHYQAVPVRLDQNVKQLESLTLASTNLNAFMSHNLGRPLDPWPPEVWDYELLTQAAIYYHPSLELARAQWQVVAAGRETARARPNPSVNFTPGYNFSATGGMTPWIPGLGFDVPVETAGKRQKRIKQADYLIESARWKLVVTAWQIRSNLRTALIDAVVSKERATLLAEQQAAQEQTVRLQEQRLAAGSVTSFEVSGAKVALIKMEGDLADNRRLEAESRSRLAEALGVPRHETESLRLSYPLVIEAAPTVVSQEARNFALQHRADILEALAAYEATQANLQLEIARQYPDLRLGNSYQWDQGDSKWSLSLTLDLPLLNQNQGPIAEAEARRKEAAVQVMNIQARILADLDRTSAAMKILNEQLAIAKRLYQATSERLEQVQRQLEAGQIDRLEYQNVRLELTATKLAYFEAQVKAAQGAGALEDVLQVPLPVISALVQAHNDSSKTELP